MTGPAPNEIIQNGTELYRLVDPQVGDLCVVHKQGRFRRARLVKINKSRVIATWSTSTSQGREQAVAKGEVYETNDGTLSGGELAGVVVQGNNPYGQGGRTGQHLEAVPPGGDGVSIIAPRGMGDY